MRYLIRKFVCRDVRDGSKRPAIFGWLGLSSLRGGIYATRCLRRSQSYRHCPRGLILTPSPERACYWCSLVCQRLTVGRFQRQMHIATASVSIPQMAQLSQTKFACSGTE